MGQSSVQEARPRRTVRSVEHAVAILQAIDLLGGSAGVSDIARQIGLSKAAAHHLLTTLVDLRLVAREPDGRRYRLSWGLYELGAAAMRGARVEFAASRTIAALALKTDASALLGIVDNDEVLYVDSTDTLPRLTVFASSGRRSPLHATATGKVLLAFGRDPHLIDRLESRGLARWTERTITDPLSLRRELNEVRKNGFGTAFGEHEMNYCSIAVPIRDGSGHLLAALAIAGQSSRIRPDSVHGLLAHLFEARNEIEAHLGVSASREELA